MISNDISSNSQTPSVTKNNKKPKINNTNPVNGESLDTTITNRISVNSVAQINSTIDAVNEDSRSNYEEPKEKELQLLNVLETEASSTVLPGSRSENNETTSANTLLTESLLTRAVIKIEPIDEADSSTSVVNDNEIGRINNIKVKLEIKPEPEDIDKPTAVVIPFQNCANAQPSTTTSPQITAISRAGVSSAASMNTTRTSCNFGIKCFR